MLSKGIQQVTGATVSTLAGSRRGVEENNLHDVRTVPAAQTGATISLGVATHEGYARPPFLLLDPFVQRTDEGNSVLLEPDPNTQAYHVRKVSLDSTTGAPSWDPTVSYGTFLLPVSAAGLHSSGHVVAIHTDSGRFGWLKPVATPPLPVLAAYSAGSGTQVGLLNSPIALAVTNAGTVLVLEAGGQISAFDLNGNPVAYFGTALTRRTLLAPGRRRLGASAQGQFTLPLVSSGTYLDLAVDGAGQMYVLYYTGDGVAPGDYRVDVYTPAGAALDTNSPGVNVPAPRRRLLPQPLRRQFQSAGGHRHRSGTHRPCADRGRALHKRVYPQLSDRDAQAEAQAEAQAPAQAQAAQPQVNGRAHRFAPLAAKVGTGDHVQG